ncbi:hypothetical protein [Herbaspirillum huttiense]|uniref:hypothetical protein n=1 Tax=Herbaspirillum huttiense TaxID=863372 RepID=UPI0039AFD9E9
MGIGTAANTHAMYGTIEHQHLDALVCWATGDFPDAGLNLVGCRDGRWFVEVDHGDRYDSMEGISKPNLSPYVQPRFFSSEQAAREFAISCIKRAHPEAALKNLQDWFDDYDKGE